MTERNETRELGSGYEGELRWIDDVLLGVEVRGPAGENCDGPKRHGDGRCCGWVPLNDGDRGWTLTSEAPLSLTPSIRCSCDVKEAGKGQHGFITDGRWVNAGGIVA